MLRLRKIRFKNFLSFGNGWTEYDLSSTKSTLIVGKVGHGKSTLLDALYFALFGNAFRNINKPTLVSSVNEKDCLVELEFDKNGHVYLIRRGIKPNIFEVFVNGELLNQEAKNRDYQKILEKQILQLNRESASQIMVLGKATFKPFMQLPSTKRRTVIEDLLGLSIFSIMNEELKKKISVSKEKAKTLKTQISFLNDKISLQKKFIEDTINAHQEHIETYEQDIAENHIRISALEAEITKRKKDFDEKEKSWKHASEIDRTMKANQEEIERLQKKIDLISSKITSQESQNICTTCHQSLPKEHIDKALASLFKEKEILDLELFKIQESMKAVKKLLDDVSLDYHASQMRESQNSLHETQSQLTATLKYVSSLQSKLTNLTKMDSNENDLRRQLEEFETERLETEAKYKQNVIRMMYFDFVEDLLADNGIKAKIIKQYIPLINHLINDYLQKMDFFVSFHLDEEFNETIKSRYRDKFSYYNFSEGEKRKLDFAIMLTFIEIAKRRNSIDTNLIIFDEIFDDSLDGDGTRAVETILSQLREKNVFMISHKIKEYEDFERTIVVEKVGNFSELTAI